VVNTDRQEGKSLVLRSTKHNRGMEKIHSDELSDLYSPNIIRVIRLRRKKWAGHLARMGRGEVHTGFWWENLRKRGHLEDPDVDGRIILRRIFKKWDGRNGLD
jgi:hypothetical protein